jgi:transglutaminase-like putative cysteine protease
MHFRVHHATRYQYSGETTLTPHIIRLRPRMSDQIHLMSYDLQLHPVPVSLVETLDAEGNHAYLAWFDKPTRNFAIVSSFSAKAKAFNPYDYIVTEPGALHLPAEYKAHASVLAPYRTQTYWDGPIVKLAEEIRGRAGNSTIQYLRELMAYFESYEKIVRETGLPLLPDELLASRAGACRDLSVMFVELCRQVGLAARFVSGYWRGVQADEKRYLHAWAEVYLPGAGWRGYDPSSGLAVTDGHVPVCASRDYAGAAPVEGGFTGDGIKAQMDWSIRISIRST